MPDRSSKRPTDPNALAKQLVDEATGAEPKYDPDDGKDPCGGRTRSQGRPEGRQGSRRERGEGTTSRRRQERPLRLAGHSN